MVKKILYINLTARMSGAEKSLLSLMAGLDRKKFQPVLLLPETGAFLGEATANGIETIILPSLIKFGEFYHFWKIPKMFRAVLKLKKIIREKEISLVHSNTPRAAYMGGLAARICRIPHFTHVRDIGMSPFAAPWKGRFIGFLSDAIVCVSQAVKIYITDRNPPLGKKINVIYNGIDLAALDRIAPAAIRRELGIPDSAPLIGAVGRIDPTKGLDTLIDAAEMTTKIFPNLRVLIIGVVFENRNKIYLDSLMKKVAEKGLGENIIFTGFRSDVLEVMKGLDVIVHPALCPDSLPRTILEAAGLKKPIAASRVGGIPEILKDGISGFLFNPGDQNALAEIVISLLRNPEAAKRLGAAARGNIENCFSIDRFLAAMTAIYESLWNEKQ